MNTQHKNNPHLVNAFGDGRLFEVTHFFEMKRLRLAQTLIDGNTELAVLSLDGGITLGRQVA